MPVRLTYEEVKSIFSEHGCTLLEKEYINSRIKMRFLCKCGREAEKTLAGFKGAPRCKECGLKNKDMSKYSTKRYRYKYEEVVKIFKDGGCKLLSTKYVNSSTHLTYLCECGEVREITLNKFLKGQRCKGCSAKRTKERLTLTIEDASRVFENGNCKLLSEEYVCSKTPMKYLCECGNISHISLNSFQKGSRCYDCGIKKLTLTTEYVINFINSEQGNGCTYISGEYINKDSKITYRCACGEIIENTFDTFRGSSKRCRPCGMQAMATGQRVPYEKVLEQVARNGQTLLTEKEEYKGLAYTDATIVCTCNRIFIRNLQDYMHKDVIDCQDCYAEKLRLMKRTPYQEVKSFIESNSDCVLITKEEEYINSVKPVDLKCPCGEVFATTFQYFKNREKHSCNRCSSYMTKGEVKIENALKKMGIEYKSQYAFKDCVKNRPLPFDFAIFDNIGNLKFLIEYDGIQHFEPVDFAGKGEEWAKEVFKGNQERDLIKNEYCFNKGIELIRIPYWDIKHLEHYIFDALVEQGLLECVAEG